MAQAAALAGRRVVITRSPERAAALADAVADAGGMPLLMPLIDFETAPEPALLDRALGSLAAGAYSWLVVSSATTVLALRRAAEARGMPLASVVPDTVRIAAVGAATRRALEAQGLKVDLVPADPQSAAGLLSVWPAGAGAVLLPQADIAAPLLRDGLVGAGADVTAVAAYQTVDFPARPEHRLSDAAEESGSGGGRPLRTAAEVRALLDDAIPSAVVAASASAARRIVSLLGPLPASARFVAIGAATAAEAARLGQLVAAVAPAPTPEGVLSALAEAFGPSAPPNQPSASTAKETL